MCLLAGSRSRCSLRSAQPKHLEGELLALSASHAAALPPSLVSMLSLRVEFTSCAGGISYFAARESASSQASLCRPQLILHDHVRLHASSQPCVLVNIFKHIRLGLADIDVCVTSRSTTVDSNMCASAGITGPQQTRGLPGVETERSSGSVRAPLELTQCSSAIASYS